MPRAYAQARMHANTRAHTHAGFDKASHALNSRRCLQGWWRVWWR